MTDRVGTEVRRARRSDIVLNGGMASKSTGSARTAPKGRATPGRGRDGGGGRLMTPTMQWIIVIVVGLAILVGIMYLLRDESADIGSGDPGGPAPSVAALAAVPPGA